MAGPMAVTPVRETSAKPNGECKKRNSNQAHSENERSSVPSKMLPDPRESPRRIHTGSALDIAMRASMF